MSAVVSPVGADAECRGARTPRQVPHDALHGRRAFGRSIPKVCAWAALVGLLYANRSFASDSSLFPVITGFDPGMGSVGTLVIINGSNLVGVATIRFNGVEAPIYGSSGDGTAVQTEVPTNAVTGPITVTTSAGTVTSTQVFQVTASGLPVVQSFTPTSGPPGTTVAFVGSNLVPATQVEFNGVDAAFSILEGLAAVVPQGATTGPITVKTSGGSFTTSSSFIVTSSDFPLISSFSPQSGPPGTVVTIAGAKFQGLSTVTFGGVASPGASALVDTQISATVPSGAKTGPIGVTTSAGTTLSASAFTVTALGAPTVTNVAPASGVPGAHVLISGENLSFVQSVEFNGVAAEFSTLAPNELSVTVPTSSTGPITVTTEGGTFTTLASFVVIGGAPAPALLSVSSWSGPPGLQVSITTTNLGAPTSVTFNGVEAPFRAYANQITAEIPVLASSGPLQVKGTAGAAVSGQAFTVYATPQLGLIASSSNDFVPLGSNIVLSVLITNRTSAQINNLVLNSRFSFGAPHSGPLVVWTNGAPAFGDVAPADLDITSLNLDQGTSVLTNGTVLCHLGSLGAGRSLRCDVEVAPRSPELLNYLAFIRGDLPGAQQPYASVLTSVLVTGTVELSVVPLAAQQVEVSWSDVNSSLKLQTSDSPLREGNWTDVTAAAQRNGIQRSVILPIGAAVQFFRLVHAGP